MTNASTTLGALVFGLLFCTVFEAYAEGDWQEVYDGAKKEFSNKGISIGTNKATRLITHYTKEKEWIKQDTNKFYEQTED